MNEVVIVSSNKDSSGGISVLDIVTGSQICPQFKNCVTDKNCMILSGNSSSSYGGYHSVGDYIFASQAQKPLIHMWQWNKSQTNDHYHIQEIMTCLCSDSSGMYLIGGSKKGYIYVWDISTGELVKSFQAHYKSIFCLVCDKPQGMFLISSSEDGLIRVWEWDLIIESNHMNSSIKKIENINPYKSWSSHTLPVKDVIIIGQITIKRVISCSLDRTVMIHDIFSGNHVLKISLPFSLECICCNHMEDILFVGSTTGSIHILDLSVHATSISAAHSQLLRIGGDLSTTIHDMKQPSNDSIAVSSLNSTHRLEGHTKAITSLQCSSDDMTLVSSSMDGSLRIWNIWTRQCVKDVKPFLGGAPITNALIVRKHDSLSLLVRTQRFTLHPLQHFSKYKDDNKAFKSSKVLSPSIIGQYNRKGDGYNSSNNVDNNVNSNSNSNDVDSIWIGHGQSMSLDKSKKEVIRTEDYIRIDGNEWEENEDVNHDGNLPFTLANPIITTKATTKVKRYMEIDPNDRLIGGDTESIKQKKQMKEKTTTLLSFLEHDSFDSLENRVDTKDGSINNKNNNNNTNQSHNIEWNLMDITQKIKRTNQKNKSKKS